MFWHAPTSQPPAATPCMQIAVSFGFFFGGLAQFCAGLLEYQRRNTFGTVAFCW